MINADDLLAKARQLNSVSTVTPAAVKAVRAAETSDLGLESKKLVSSRAFLTNGIVDDSGSMEKLAPAVIEALAKLKSELQMAVDEGDASECEVLMTLCFLNKRTVQPYARISECIDIDERNYHPNGGTPLFTRTLQVLGALIRKVEELGRSGVTAQTYTFIVSDGQPTDGQGVDGEQAATAAEVNQLISSLTETKQHIVCGVNVGGEARAAFLQMGIHDKWIIDPAKDPGAFKQAMAKVSRVSRSVSQSRRDFQSAADRGIGEYR